MHENTVIETFFNVPVENDPAIFIGIGDDAAVLSIPTDQQLVISIDTLNQDVHFPEQTSPFDIGHKAVAVNLSDLAAMGALPKWMTLSLSLPKIEQRWLNEFSQGLFSVLNQYEVNLIGGDLTRGPLSMTLQAHGLVPDGKAILRSTAKPGDIIYVSGELGSARLALHVLQKKIKLVESDFIEILPMLNRPRPQVELGLALRGIATAMLDISDGVLNDLPRILTASHCGAEIDLQKLPLNSILQKNLAKDIAYEYAFVGGDDYQLCFTVAPQQQAEVKKISENLGIALTPIGVINNSDALTFLNSTMTYTEFKAHAFQHF